MSSSVKRPLRVGIVSRVGAPTDGGSQAVVSTLLSAAAISQTPHRFIRIDASSGKLDQRNSSQLGHAKAAEPLLQRIRRRMRRGSRSDRRMAELERNICDQEIDVVWFTNPPGAVVSVPYIATVWDLAHRTRPYFPEVSVTGWTWPAREQAYRTVLPRASFVLTGAEAGKTEIVRSYGVDPDNVIVIPLPVPDFDPPVAATAEDASIRHKYGIGGDFIMYPAQFWPHKNHINLLLALAHLKQHHNLVSHAVFTGSDKGNMADVQQCIYELGLANEAHILGFVPRADLVALYRNALALVFPS